MTPDEAYAEALRRIREAKEAGAVRLDLSRLALNRFPRELASLTSLQKLDIFECGQLSGDLSPLASLTALQYLDLSYCLQLSGDLTPLANLTSFQYLGLAGCRQLSGDLSPLAGLTSLRWLQLPGCDKLSGDLSPLADLTSLNFLDLSGCKLSGDLSPLTGLASLQWLHLNRCLGVRRFAQLEPLLPASEEDRQRQEVVERLCRTLEKEDWQVVCDKTSLKYGDPISTFMKTPGQADLVIVVLSAKYLQSPYCMTELYALYQNARQEKQEFLNRIIPLVLKDARIGIPEERVEHAKHWETRYLKLKAELDYLSPEDFGLYQGMKDWRNHVGRMLTYVNDVLHPHGFEDIVKDDFAALRQMLSGRR